MLSYLVANDKEIFFPQVSDIFTDTSLVEITTKYLKAKGYTPAPFEDEKIARESVRICISKGSSPCYYFKSDTTGEKAFEEFYAEDERVSLDKFETIGVVKFELGAQKSDYASF